MKTYFIWDNEGKFAFRASEVSEISIEHRSVGYFVIATTQDKNRYVMRISSVESVAMEYANSLIKLIESYNR